MKVKKLFAGLLTLAMVLSLNVTAFAAGGDTTYDDVGSVTVTKSYQIANNGTNAPAADFELEVVDSYVDDGELSNAPALTISDASFTEPVGATTTANFTITLPDYERVGVYVYELTETVPETGLAGVTYNTENTDIFLKVTVIRQGGQLIRVVSLHENKVTGEKYDDVLEPATIINKYEAGSLKIAKNVTGLLGDTEKYFEFKVTVNNPADKTAPASYNVDVSNGEGDTKNDHSNPLTITAGQETKFWLKSGDFVVINNLPYGVTYDVEEVGAGTATEENLEGYKTTCESSDNDNTIDETATTITYTNSKGAGEEIDTGVYLDNLPYIIIFVGVLAAVAVLVIRRRRVDD